MIVWDSSHLPLRTNIFYEIRNVSPMDFLYRYDDLTLKLKKKYIGIGDNMYFKYMCYCLEIFTK